MSEIEKQRLVEKHRVIITGIYFVIVAVLSILIILK